MTTHPTPRRPRKRRRRAIVDPRRFAPIALTALAALVAGLVVGARHVPSELKAVAEFAADWQRADYAGMYATLSDAAGERTSQARLERTYKHAAAVLTLTKLTTGPVRDDGDAVRVPLTMDTRIFGRLTGTLVVPTGDREQGGKGVDWSSELVFPGLRPGEKLKRETDLPPRAAIEARDGTAIATGRDRLPDASLGKAASGIAGRIGPAPPARAAELRARGVPDGAAVGLTGLEREFHDRLTRRPGAPLSARDP